MKFLSRLLGKCDHQDVLHQVELGGGAILRCVKCDRVKWCTGDEPKNQTDWFRVLTDNMTKVGDYADWRYHQSDGVNMWTWKPELGVTYMVTQHGDNIQAHLTTGTRYKYCRTIGAYATVKEAKARAEEHRHNDSDQGRRASDSKQP